MPISSKTETGTKWHEFGIIQLRLGAVVNPNTDCSENGKLEPLSITNYTTNLAPPFDLSIEQKTLSAVQSCTRSLD
jgi:hypothetical protein